MRNGRGDLFQKETKYRRGELPGGFPDGKKKQEPYKIFSGVPKFKLSPPDLDRGGSLWEVLKKRRSVRRFRAEALAERDLSLLLWAAQGVTETRSGYALRTAPSAGALFPVETYLVIQDVEDFQQGVYHYDVRHHALDQLRAGDVREDIASAALDQDFLSSGNVVFVWTAFFERSKWKYRERAYRYVYLDAGHIAQNVALGATGLGLASCQIAAFYDDEVNAVVGADGVEESTIFMTVVGKPA